MFFPFFQCEWNLDFSFGKFSLFFVGNSGISKIIWIVNVKSLWENKMKIFPSCCCFSTTVWLHHLDTNEMFEARWELYKDADCCFEQILKQHLTKRQLYGHLSPITQIIQVRWEKHAGHYWRSKDKLINKILQRTPTHGHTSFYQLAKTYIHWLSADTGCHQEDLPRWMVTESKESTLSWWY